jgi:hypothetical protein
MTGFLRRYTELPYLLHALHTKKLTLLSPASWGDKNDCRYLQTYKDGKSLKSVLAMCFTEASETYHHWKVFAGDSSGVCIQFDKERLLAGLVRPGIRVGAVNYPTIKSIRQTVPTLEDIPFTKRYPFRDEKEFRILYEDANQSMDILDVDLEIGAITRVVLNPWLPGQVVRSVKALVKAVPGCNQLKVYQSSLVNNGEWQRIGSPPGRVLSP